MRITKQIVYCIMLLKFCLELGVHRTVENGIEERLVRYQVDGSNRSSSCSNVGNRRKNAIRGEDACSFCSCRRNI